jgi:23S rRNA (adenine2503-C2)-methyltransferase
LIPLNPVDSPAADLRPSTPGRIKDFAAVLRAAGFPVTVRYSLGADVAAACGQLVQRRYRMLQTAGATAD